MATDYFLKIDKIEGESKDSKHPNEIDVEGWSWGASNTGGFAYGGGGGAGKVSMQDFNFAMKMNKASPKLLLACASGEHIKKALLTVRKAGKEQQEYLLIHFEDLLVASYQTGGSGGEVVPVESISLNYSKMKMEYKEQKKDGSLNTPLFAAWDLKANKAW